MKHPSDPSAHASGETVTHRARPRALTHHDRETADALARAAELVQRVLADTELTALLEEQGYDAVELQAGVTLHAAAEEVFAACQQTLGELDQMDASFTAAWEHAREEYLEFRWVIRHEYTDFYTHQVLQVLDQLSDNPPEFIAQAAVSYRAAQLLQPSQPLADLGLTPERLQNAMADLRRLARLELALHAGRSRAERQRDERDLAIAMLNLWMRDFQQAAQTALGDTAPPASPRVPLHERLHRSGRVQRGSRNPRSHPRFSLRFPPSVL